MTTAVPSATVFSWPERTVVTPSGSSTVSGANDVEQVVAAGRPGSPASRGRMAGPLPSSAAASSSSSRGAGALDQDRVQRAVRHDR